jgi:biopolymer transport protein ExbB/TolQ
MFGNIVIESFVAGGWVMWPILLVAMVAVCVVGERAVWWTLQSVRRDPGTLEKVLASLEGGDFSGASRQSKDSTDPVLRMIGTG